GRSRFTSNRIRLAAFYLDHLRLFWRIDSPTLVYPEFTKRGGLGVSAPLGQSLELFFIDGRPDGMLTAEVFNWTGHVLLTPRTQISEALKRQEARYTGVYILFGENDEGPLAYIGEGDDISDRIRSHAIKKDWWTSAALITSAANNLHKAHV